MDGEIEVRHSGEFEHARLQFVLASIFRPSEKAWNLLGVTAQRIRIAPDRVRVCDLCLLDRSAPRERVLTLPPFLCVEILSPEDRLARAKIVLEDYRDIGVPNIWLLDPIRQAAYTYDATGLHPFDGTTLTIAGTPVALELTELFAEME